MHNKGFEDGCKNGIFNLTRQQNDRDSQTCASDRKDRTNVDVEGKYIRRLVENGKDVLYYVSTADSKDTFILSNTTSHIFGTHIDMHFIGFVTAIMAATTVVVNAAPNPLNPLETRGQCSSQVCQTDSRK